MKNLIIVLLVFSFTSSFGVNIYGQIFCAGSETPVIHAQIVVKNITGNLDTCYSDNMGFFSIEVPEIKTVLRVYSDEYYPNQLGTQIKKYFSSDQHTFNFSKDSKDTSLTIDLEVVPQSTVISLVLFFKKDSASGDNLLHQLENMLVVFKDNPSIQKIDLIGYTSKLENSTLRNLRAQEILKLMQAMKFPLNEIVVNNSKPNTSKYIQASMCDNRSNYAPPASPLNQRVEVVISTISGD
jgi:hypothetical protein